MPRLAAGLSLRRGDGAGRGVSGPPPLAASNLQLALAHVSAAPSLLNRLEASSRSTSTTNGWPARRRRRRRRRSGGSRPLRCPLRCISASAAPPHRQTNAPHTPLARCPPLTNHVTALGPFHATHPAPPSIPTCYRLHRALFAPCQPSPPCVPQLPYILWQTCTSASPVHPPRDRC